MVQVTWYWCRDLSSHDPAISEERHFSDKDIRISCHLSCEASSPQLSAEQGSQQLLSASPAEGRRLQHLQATLSGKKLRAL